MYESDNQQMIYNVFRNKNQNGAACSHVRPLLL